MDQHADPAVDPAMLLMDLASGLSAARGHRAAQGVLDRCEVTAGDFFSAVLEPVSFTVQQILPTDPESTLIAVAT